MRSPRRASPLPKPRSEPPFQPRIDNAFRQPLASAHMESPLRPVGARRPPRLLPPLRSARAGWRCSSGWSSSPASSACGFTSCTSCRSASGRRMRAPTPTRPSAGFIPASGRPIPAAAPSIPWSSRSAGSSGAISIPSCSCSTCSGAFSDPARGRLPAPPPWPRRRHSRSRSAATPMACTACRFTSSSSCGMRPSSFSLAPSPWPRGSSPSTGDSRTGSGSPAPRPPSSPSRKTSGSPFRCLRRRDALVLPRGDAPGAASGRYLCGGLRRPLHRRQGIQKHTLPAAHALEPQEGILLYGRTAQFTYAGWRHRARAQGPDPPRGRGLPARGLRRWHQAPRLHNNEILKHTRRPASSPASRQAGQGRHRLERPLPRPGRWRPSAPTPFSTASRSGRDLLHLHLTSGMHFKSPDDSDIDSLRDLLQGLDHPDPIVQSRAPWPPWIASRTRIASMPTTAGSKRLAVRSRPGAPHHPSLAARLFPVAPAHARLVARRGRCLVFHHGASGHGGPALWIATSSPRSPSCSGRSRMPSSFFGSGPCAGSTARRAL